MLLLITIKSRCMYSFPNFTILLCWYIECSTKSTVNRIQQTVRGWFLVTEMVFRRENPVTTLAQCFSVAKVIQLQSLHPVHSHVQHFHEICRFATTEGELKVLKAACDKEIIKAKTIWVRHFECAGDEYSSY